MNNNTKSIQVHAIQIHKQMNEKQSVTITMTPETHILTKYVQSIQDSGQLDQFDKQQQHSQIKRQQTNSFSFQNPGVETKQF